jgi:hypothetical protein
MRRAAIVQAATFALFAELPLHELPLYKLPFAEFTLNQLWPLGVNFVSKG